MLIQCHLCGRDVSTDANQCPHCGTQYFLPPPSQTIHVKCKLLNPTKVNDDFFSDGEYLNYRFLELWSSASVEEAAGETQFLKGGRVYLQGDSILLPNEKNGEACRVHKGKPDQGWNPVVDSCCDFTFIPKERNDQSFICSLGITPTAIDAESEADSVVCIKGTEKKIEINRSTSEIAIEIEIIDNGEKRSVPRYSITHGFFRDRVKEYFSEVSVYQYEIKSLEIK